LAGHCFDEGEEFSAQTVSAFLAAVGGRIAGANSCRGIREPFWRRRIFRRRISGKSLVFLFYVTGGRAVVN